MTLRQRLRDETGVFVPGLMGAGIILSIIMLLGDGIRKAFPALGRRSRAARAARNALGRVEDLASVVRGEPAQPAQLGRVPRSRNQAAGLGTAAVIAAAVLRDMTLDLYNAAEGVLSDRAWTLSFGYIIVGVLVTAAFVWLSSALLGSRRPEWLEQLASWGPIGTLPALDVDQPAAQHATVIVEDHR